MLEIKLDGRIVNGRIELSQDQQKELTMIKSGSAVEVIVRSEEPAVQTHKPQRDLLSEMTELGYDSIIDYLMDYPVEVKDFKPLTRQELYSGERRFD